MKPWDNEDRREQTTRCRFKGASEQDNVQELLGNDTPDSNTPGNNDLKALHDIMRAMKRDHKAFKKERKSPQKERKPLQKECKALRATLESMLFRGSSADESRR